MTQKELTKLISENIKNQLLNEEDGKWEYISGVLFRYRIPHQMSDENGQNTIKILFNDDSERAEIESFLNKMGYFFDEEMSKNGPSDKPWYYFTQQNQTLNESISKSEVMDIVKKDKDFEKKIKDIVRDTVTDLFRVLYQHNGIFKTLGK